MTLEKERLFQGIHWNKGRSKDQKGKRLSWELVSGKVSLHRCLNAYLQFDGHYLKELWMDRFPLEKKLGAFKGPFDRLQSRESLQLQKLCSKIQDIFHDVSKTGTIALSYSPILRRKRSTTVHTVHSYDAGSKSHGLFCAVWRTKQICWDV